MIEGLGEIGFRDRVLSESNTLHCSLKNHAGRMFIDARKWLKYPNLDHYLPSKKGLSMELEEWKGMIPLIQELIAEGESGNVK